MHHVHHVGLVGERTTTAEEFVLQHDRQIVDAVGLRQAAIGVLAIADDHHAGKARIDLRGGAAMQVRMEPRRRFGLPDGKLRGPHATRPDGVVRPAVHLRGHQQPVPVQCGLLFKAVLHPEWDGIAAPDAHDRPQVARRDAPRPHRRPKPEPVLGISQRQRKRLAGAGFDEPGDRQRWPVGLSGPGPARQCTGCQAGYRRA
jgi:hypothetical protein